jgi:hypothetical protein
MEMQYDFCVVGTEFLNIIYLKLEILIVESEQVGVVILYSGDFGFGSCPRHWLSRKLFCIFPSFFTKIAVDQAIIASFHVISSPLFTIRRYTVWDTDTVVE